MSSLAHTAALSGILGRMPSGSAVMAYLAGVLGVFGSEEPNVHHWQGVKSRYRPGRWRSVARDLAVKHVRGRLRAAIRRILALLAAENRSASRFPARSRRATVRHWPRACLLSPFCASMLRVLPSFPCSAAIHATAALDNLPELPTRNKQTRHLLGTGFTRGFAADRIDANGTHTLRYPVPSVKIPKGDEQWTA